MGIAIGVCAVSCLCLVAMMLLAYQRRADEEYDDLSDDVEFADVQTDVTDLADVADPAAGEEDVVFEPAEYVREEDRIRPAVSAAGELIWVDEDELVWHEIVAWTGLTEDSSPMHRVLGA